MNGPCEDCRRSCEEPCWRVEHGMPMEAVRCRECKHRAFIGKWPLRDYFCKHPLGLKSIMHESDFCSYGEPREEG